MFTVTAILAVAALIMTLVNAANGKVPLWIPVVLLCVIVLIGQAFPLAR